MPRKLLMIKSNQKKRRLQPLLPQQNKLMKRKLMKKILILM